MQLPFTDEQFLQVFAAYNRALWPFATLLWLGTVVAFAALFGRSSRGPGWVTGVLAIHWAWAGVGYHLAFFRQINSAATLFGVLFLVEAGLILWRGTGSSELTFEVTGWGRAITSAVLVLYGLAYPALGLLAGLQFPFLPSFGVPCPTTILTAGALLLVPRKEVWPVAVIPILWTVVGGSAAFLLGIKADLALLVAGVVLLIHLFYPRTESA